MQAMKKSIKYKTYTYAYRSRILESYTKIKQKPAQIEQNNAHVNIYTDIVRMWFPYFTSSVKGEEGLAQKAISIYMCILQKALYTYNSILLSIKYSITMYKYVGKNKSLQYHNIISLKGHTLLVLSSFTYVEHCHHSKLPTKHHYQIGEGRLPPQIALVNPTYVSYIVYHFTVLYVQTEVMNHQTTKYSSAIEYTHIYHRYICLQVQ